MLSGLDHINNYIFDMDGTLINSAEEVLQCLRTACEINGAAIDQKKFSSDVIGPPLKEIIEAIIISNLNEDLLLKIMSDFRRIYDNDEKDESTFYPNVYDWLLTSKESKKRLFLATNKPTQPTFRLIRMLELDMFEDIYTIDKYPEKNLSKEEMIREIIKKYELNKEETIMIGDAPSDIKAAQDAGIKAIGVLWGYGDHSTILKEISDLTLELNDLKIFEKTS